MTTDDTDRRPLHVAVALDGAGWHPAAWRLAGLAPRSLFTAGYWVDLVALAEGGLLDFVTFEDSLGLQSSRWDRPDDRLDQVKGRLDAVLTAARVAPSTTAIGLVPTAYTTHTEPFHVSKALATLDYVSGGRAGWRAQVTARQSDAAHFGRRQLYPVRPGGGGDDPEALRAVADLFEEASDHVEVVRRLWDSWEDDAVIRDVDQGRFVDVDKLHAIDFSGRFFTVRGPSITPRPPQGQPVVTALAHGTPAYRFAASAADVVFVTPMDEGDAARISAEVREHERSLGRRQPLLIFADLLVGARRRARGSVAPVAAPRCHQRGRVPFRRPAIHRALRGPGRTDGQVAAGGYRRIPAAPGCAEPRSSGHHRGTGARPPAPRCLPAVVRELDVARPPRPGPTGEPLFGGPDRSRPEWGP